MTFTEIFTLFWLLPALATLLGVLQYWRVSFRKPEKLSKDEWTEAIMFSIFYPLVWFILLMEYISPLLVKERSIWD